MASKLDTELRAQITAQIRKEYEEESLKHSPSGKLSAGQLGKPLLEQVLKVIGVPQKPVEDYALGLFRRGNSVEKEILELMKPDKEQVQVEYKNTVGVVDAIKGDMIYEVKSIKNSQVPYIDPENKKKPGTYASYDGPKWAHTLQAGLYALALDKPYFTILYVSADDLRTYPHIISTSEVKDEIDNIIHEVYRCIELGELPIWQAKEKWQTNPQYSSYPDWMMLSPDGAIKKLENHYPDIYKRFIGGKNAK